MNLITDGPKIIEKLLGELQTINGNLMFIHGELQRQSSLLEEIRDARNTDHG